MEHALEQSEIFYLGENWKYLVIIAYFVHIFKTYWPKFALISQFCQYRQFNVSRMLKNFYF